jgi:hypothetical protein
MFAVSRAIDHLDQLLGRHPPMPRVHRDLAGLNVYVDRKHVGDFAKCLLDRVAALLSKHPLDFKDEHIYRLRCSERDSQNHQ